MNNIKSEISIQKIFVGLGFNLFVVIIKKNDALNKIKYYAA